MRSNAQSLPDHIDLPELVKLRSVIESGFTHDWLLRVEHTGHSDTTCSWQEWGQPRFVIADASTILMDVAACHVQHPTHAIRLCAEKLNPRTRLLYCVFRSSGTATPSLRRVPEPLDSMQPANDWSGNRIKGVANR